MSRMKLKSETELQTRSNVSSSLQVLCNGKENYQSIEAVEYVENFDFSDVLDYQANAQEICPSYDQVITNRNYGVLKMVEKCLIKNSELWQVVILGAGQSPIGLELAGRWRYLQVYEIDSDQMAEKQDLYQAVSPSKARRVNCIQSDIADSENTWAELLSAGWRSECPTLVVIENLSYLMQEADLADLVDHFREADGSHLVCEYLTEESAVPADFYNACAKLFELSNMDLDALNISYFDSTDLQSLLDARRIKVETLHTLERKRTGENEYFTADLQRWNEISLFEL